MGSWATILSLGARVYFIDPDEEEEMKLAYPVM